MAGTPGKRSETVAYDDVDDVVEIATRMMHDDEDRFDVSDLHEVGRDLDIPPEYMERARAELERRRAEAARRNKAAAARKRQRLTVGGVAAAVVVAIVVIAWGVTASGLREHHAEVQARAAQVHNVRERQARVVAMMASRPDSLDKDAELIGAENRVRVETQRYAEAAAAYNDAAGGWFAGMVASVSGLPDAVPVTPP